jgi:uncharacterized protein (DUF4213/DUF364 family)
VKQRVFYNELIDKFKKIAEENGLMNETVAVTGRVLATQEAIGNPLRKDFPILKGKEKLMQAEFKGEKGQAFTDMPGIFSGTIEEIINRPLETNFDRAVLISTINAVCKYLGIAKKSIHCKDEEPEKCSLELITYIKERYESPKIALIGLQPSMLERLSKYFKIRVVDLAEENIGKRKFGVEIEDGMTRTEEVLNWCDLILATGSTVANGSITNFIGEKPAVFYGTSIAGPAALMNLTRFCAEGK